ncbi:hypothetical protein G7K_0573-t1 [Saitoella complicata NRRL Y-17804]|uniref:Uncharacterized protein n=1 Tax=Saitoella complicata (strain BCRC 22490 / CBS 7301 / JCM 7358 / NBRC 10748 / NRRL Y-17804) TaxID=698492 RepID=A0A0E9N9D5_SAICN|nr:hypothetical protein G7K_0573-t1 [Saitoella complicata NRRL Y-17804]
MYSNKPTGTSQIRGSSRTCNGEPFLSTRALVAQVVAVQEGLWRWGRLRTFARGKRAILLSDQSLSPFTT